MERYRALFRDYYLFGIKKYLPDKIPERKQNRESIYQRNNYGRKIMMSNFPE